MKPRVLVFDFVTAFGGVQRVLGNLLPKLARSVDVTFLDPLDEPVTARYFRQQGVLVEQRPLRPQVRALGVGKSAVRALMVFATLGPIYAVYLIGVAINIRRRETQILYVNSMKSLVLGWLIKLTNKRVRFVCHVHGLDPNSSSTRFYAWVLSKTDCIIAVSADVKHKLIQVGLDAERVHVVHNGVDVDALREASASQYPESRRPEFTCLIACNIQPGKGIHLAIEAIGELKRSGKEAHLDVVGAVPEGGDFGYAESLRALAGVEQVSDRVHFFGWRDDVYALMKRCDVLLLPSIVEESFGMVLAEAMALGIPVIGSRIGGIPEVIRHLETGLIIEPGSMTSLSEAIHTLMDNPELCRQLGTNGPAWVSAQFTVDRQAEKIIALLNSLLASSCESNS